MRLKIDILLLLVFCAMSATWAAFKDFVIENEKNLQKFSYDGEIIYDDISNDDFDPNEAYNAIDSSCVDLEGIDQTYDIFQRIDLNENILSETIRHLANVASFQELAKLLDKGYISEKYDECVSSQDYEIHYRNDEYVEDCGGNYLH